uniref:Neuromedin U C-terminal domain-containing protein n=1 Tax=Gadus morhua TaxID=8049 RepID=A0A8C5FJ30_GADMO
MSVCVCVCVCVCVRVCLCLIDCVPSSPAAYTSSPYQKRQRSFSPCTYFTCFISHTLLALKQKTINCYESLLFLQDDLQGPTGIQSRGFFLYRPRNGRRSQE